MSFSEKIYAFLPRHAQDAAASVFGLYRHWLRFGRGYDEHLRGYLSRERWSREQLLCYEQAVLRKLLSDAVAHVPYYRDTWSSSEHGAARRGELGKLPILEKGPVRADPGLFVREDVRPWLTFKFNTSGSTGTPVTSIWTPDEVRNSRALREARSVQWAGASFSQGRATFSGRMVVPDSESQGPFHRYNFVERQVYFSAFHLSSRNAMQYVDALWAHKTQWLTGYAVSYYLLARFILEQGLKVPPLRALVTTSEKLTDEMRTVMEAAYGCKVYEEYSSVENAVFASECEHGSLHVSSDAGIIEILRPDGTACEPGEVGEVVATSFVRQFQPFIRYRLGDLASWSEVPCACGRDLPVLKEVVGRVEDVVVGPDGRQMVRFHGVFVGIRSIAEAQVIQEDVDLIRVKVVPSADFGVADEQEVIGRVRQRLGAVRVVVETVSSIPRTAAGKFKAVISKLAPR